MTPNPALTDQIDLSTTRVPSGHSIAGALVVVNHSAVAIDLTQRCRPVYTVQLTNSHYVPQVAFPADCSSRALIINRGPIDCQSK